MIMAACLMASKGSVQHKAVGPLQSGGLGSWRIISMHTTAFS